MWFQRGLTTYEPSFFEFFPDVWNLAPLGLIQLFALGALIVVVMLITMLIHWSITKWFPDNWQRVKETLGLED